MGRMKEKLYNFFVRKNGRVCYEYERYVREHMEEHRLHRFKHLRVLMKLNWFYRVKKGNTPYLYWDVPLDPTLAHCVNNNGISSNNTGVKRQNMARKIPEAPAYCESRRKPYPLAVHLAKAYAKYDYVIFNVYDVLLYTCFNDKQNFYDLVGQKLGVPMFGRIREKAEEEVRNRVRISGNKNSVTIEEIYKAIEKYTKIDAAKGIETEIGLLESITRVNPYMKSIYDMVSYKTDRVFFVADSYYTSKQLGNILQKKGIIGYKEILVSCEVGKSILEKTMLEMLDAKLETKNILYIDVNLQGQRNAKALGWDIWEYEDVKIFGNSFKFDGMSTFTSDLYSSIIAQHMYCGQYIHPLQYEVGFLYYGIFVAGYIKWLDKQIKKYNIKKFFFQESTGELLKKCYEINGKDSKVKSDILWMTEDFAVKMLIDKYPIFFYEHFINKYLGGNKPISFYLEKMGLLDMAGELSHYGLSASGLIARDSLLYGAFIDFIEDNFDVIKGKYTEEKNAFCQYLKGLDISEGEIAVADVTGRGYIALALERLLEEELHLDCKVRELTALQLIEAGDCRYNKCVEAYITADNIRQGDLKLIGNELLRNRTINILTNIAPKFKGIMSGEMGQLEFTFEEVYPWKYQNIANSQQGIVDFVKEYYSVFSDFESMAEVSAEDVRQVLKNLYAKPDYITKAFTIVRE